MVDSEINQTDIQGSGIREEVTNIKAKWNLLVTSNCSLKQKKEDLQTTNLQLKNEIKQMEENRLL